jgi:hypothetical protein
MLRLLINAERSIKDLQDDFTEAYPFLRLEFFRNEKARQDRYPAAKQIPSQRKLKEAWTRKKEEGELEIRDDMTVLELENALMDRFGLAAQVFRKSGNIWLETIRTDSWTLSHQNRHGMEISNEVIHKPEIDAYDLRRDPD